MNLQDQIKALSELAGRDCSGAILYYYDHIIPLIQKQPHHVIADIYDGAMRDKGWTDGVVRLFNYTPAQLCEALLRATGKWRDASDTTTIIYGVEYQ